MWYFFFPKPFCLFHAKLSASQLKCLIYDFMVAILTNRPAVPPEQWRQTCSYFCLFQQTAPSVSRICFKSIFLTRLDSCLPGRISKPMLPPTPHSQRLAHQWLSVITSHRMNYISFHCKGPVRRSSSSIFELSKFNPTCIFKLIFKTNLIQQYFPFLCIHLGIYLFHPYCINYCFISILKYFSHL